MTDFEELKPEIPGEQIPRDETFEYCQDFSMGFALKVRKKPTKYSANQTDYLRRLFLNGQKGGKKYQADEIVEMMKHATKDGNPNELRFTVSEWLTEAQIRYHLAKMTIQLKNSGTVDLNQQVERAELHEAIQENDAEIAEREAGDLFNHVNNHEYEVNLSTPQSHPWIVS